MKIILSTEAIHPPLAGIGRYAWELATRLPLHPDVSSVRYMSDGGWCDLPSAELPKKVESNAESNPESPNSTETMCSGEASPVEKHTVVEVQAVPEVSKSAATVNHSHQEIQAPIAKRQASSVEVAVVEPIVEPVLNFKGRIRRRLERVVLGTYRLAQQSIWGVYWLAQKLVWLTYWLALRVFYRLMHWGRLFSDMLFRLKHRIIYVIHRIGHRRRQLGDMMHHGAHRYRLFTDVLRRNILPPWLRRFLGQNPIVAHIYAILMPWRASRHLDKVKTGIFHGPNYFVPRTHLPCVVTIHDLSIYRFPQWHPKARIDRMRAAIPEAIKRASLIIAISEATRLEVIQTFNLPPEKVHTVLLGVDQIYHPRSDEELSPILAKYDLVPGGYSFFVSTIEPRKNLCNLIAAYGLLPEEARQRWPLVLVGGRGWQSDDIHAAIELASAAGWLKYLGFVDQADLPVLYAGSRLFTYPSWYEGFGLPIAEAMASGVPVLTSNNSSMPEVAAGAALLVDPANVVEISENLQKGLEDQTWRELAITRGLQRAAELTWDACVNNTVAAYQRISVQR